MRTWIVLFLLLAGCSAAPTRPSTSDEPTPQAYAALVATETTGVIRGVVFDAAIRPLPNVEVRLDPGNQVAHSDKDGRFGFTALKPGAYRMESSKFGYIKSQTSASVVAGDANPPIVKVQLDADPQTASYYSEYKWSSFIESYADGTTKGASDPNFQRQIILDRKPDWITVESVWSSTQSLDKALSQNFYWEGDGTLKVTGESPLSQAIDGAKLQPGRGVHDSMTIRVYGQPTTLNQQYTVYVHGFFGYKPPEKWRFSSGEPVPTPPTVLWIR